MDNLRKAVSQEQKYKLEGKPSSSMKLELLEFYPKTPKDKDFIPSDDILERQKSNVTLLKESITLDFQTTNQSSITDATSYSKLDLQSQLEILRNLKLFPIFGDVSIAKFSVNYFLYLEFFRVAIKVFSIMFILFTILYGVYFGLSAYTAILDSPNLVAIVYGSFGLIALISLRFLHIREEKKLIDHYILHDFQWTEKLFTLLVDGVPLNVTEAEIRDHLDNLLSPIKDGVKHVLFVQDSYEYSEIEQQLTRVQEHISVLEKEKCEDDRVTKKKEKLLEEHKKLDLHLRRLEEEFLREVHFKGKIIVIFNTIEARTKILEHFKIPIPLIPLVHLLFFTFKRYRLRGKLIRISEIPEPEDIIFSNLYYPKKKKFFRILLAYMGSIFVLLTILFGLSRLKGFELYSSIGEFGNQTVTYTLTVAAVVLNFILERIYRRINTLLVFHSRLEADINILNYGIFICLQLYILIQVIPATAGREVWTKQLILLMVLYLSKIILIKFLTICLTTKAIRENKLSQSSQLLSKVTQSLHNRYAEFDFIKGISRIVPFVLIPFTFIVLNPCLILILAIIFLYIIAIIDKYRMLRLCNPFKIKSASYMIKAFRVFRWDIPCISWGTFLVVTSYLWSFTDRYEIASPAVYWTSASCGALVAIILACFTKPLNSTFKRTFFKKHSEIHYDSVCQNFTGFYRDKDPVRQIKQINELRIK